MKIELKMLKSNLNLNNLRDRLICGSSLGVYLKEVFRRRFKPVVGGGKSKSN